MNFKITPLKIKLYTLIFIKIFVTLRFVVVCNPNDYEIYFQIINMNNELDIFVDYLKQHNLRCTPQRNLILKNFLEMEGHVTVEDLHKKIRPEDPTIGIATLYRTMKLLIDAGLVEMHNFNDKTTYERLYMVKHHDHLICQICNKTVEFEHPLIEKYQQEVCERHGFALKSHRMELFGVCSKCQK